MTDDVVACCPLCLDPFAADDERALILPPIVCRQCVERYRRGRLIVFDANGECFGCDEPEHTDGCMFRALPLHGPN